MPLVIGVFALVVAASLVAAVGGAAGWFRSADETSARAACTAGVAAGWGGANASVRIDSVRFLAAQDRWLVEGSASGGDASPLTAVSWDYKCYATKTGDVFTATVDMGDPYQD